MKNLELLLSANLTKRQQELEVMRCIGRAVLAVVDCKTIDAFTEHGSHQW